METSIWILAVCSWLRVSQREKTVLLDRRRRAVDLFPFDSFPPRSVSKWYRSFVSSSPLCYPRKPSIPSLFYPIPRKKTRTVNLAWRTLILRTGKDDFVLDSCKVYAPRKKGK